MQKLIQIIEKYKIVGILPVLGIMLFGSQTVLGQEDAASVAEPTVVLEDPAQSELLSTEELAELVGPIALYPDDLVAIVLPAATYPLQIAQAANFLDDRKNDPSLESDEDWDDSVVALLNYPEVVAMMNDDLTWTWKLGNAVLNQQADVVEAIGGFRDKAYAAGNLKSDDRQNVVVEEDAIEITPVDPQVIYVPYYEPAQVVVVQRAPVYHYYPYAYPVYYYPYPYGYSFSAGYFWGVTTAFTIGWHSHYIHQHYSYYPSHPYYGHHYYPRHYTRYYPPARHPVRPAPYRASYDHRDRYAGGDRWQSQDHQGARPVRWSDSGRNSSGAGSNVVRRDADRNRSTAQISSDYRNALARDSSLRQVRTADNGSAARGTGWKDRSVTSDSSRTGNRAVTSNSHNSRSWRPAVKDNTATSPQDSSSADSGNRNSRVAATGNTRDSSQLQRQVRQGLEQDSRQREARGQTASVQSRSNRASAGSTPSRAATGNASRSSQIGDQVRQELQQDTRQRNSRRESGNTSGQAIANTRSSQATNQSRNREASQARSNSSREIRQADTSQVRSQPAPQVRSEPVQRSQPEARTESRSQPRQESRGESSGSNSRSSSSRQRPRSKPR